MNEFMQEAIQEAYEGIRKHHGGPFGCVIVKDQKIIGRGHNMVLKNQDPTCHGEMQAIRDAAKNSGSHDLSDCTLYTTAAPCPMCQGAILWANIKNVYYGCTIQDTAHLGFRDEDFFQRMRHAEDANSGFAKVLMKEECIQLFEDYNRDSHELY